MLPPDVARDLSMVHAGLQKRRIGRSIFTRCLRILRARGTLGDGFSKPFNLPSQGRGPRGGHARERGAGSGGLPDSRRVLRHYAGHRGVFLRQDEGSQGFLLRWQSGAVVGVWGLAVHDHVQRVCLCIVFGARLPSGAGLHHDLVDDGALRGVERAVLCRPVAADEHHQPGGIHRAPFRSLVAAVFLLGGRAADCDR